MIVIWAVNAKKWLMIIMWAQYQTKKLFCTAHMSMEKVDLAYKCFYAPPIGFCMGNLTTLGIEWVTDKFPDLIVTPPTINFGQFSAECCLNPKQVVVDVNIYEMDTLKFCAKRVSNELTTEQETITLG